MNIRLTLTNSIRVGLNFCNSIGSALAWANILFGHSDARIGLVFFGGLCIPFLDKMLFDKMKRGGFLTPLSALAGLSAVVVEFIINPNHKVLGTIFWLEGTDLIVVNKIYLGLFVAMYLSWGFVFYKARAHSQA